MKNEQTKIMKKKSFVYGAIILGLSSIICKILGAIFRLPLTNLIGANGIGIYQLVFPIFALFLVVSSSGIPVALSKIISKEYSKQNYKNIKIIFKNSLTITAILGLFFSILIFILAKPIAIIQQNERLIICYYLLCPSVFLGTIISTFRGYFQGFEIMSYSGISQIIEQLFKLIFGLLFAYLLFPYGVVYGVAGAFIGVTLSELSAFIFLLIVFKRKKIDIDFSQNNDAILTNKTVKKLIIKESLPITFAQIFMPIVSVIDSLIIVRLLNVIGFDFESASTLYGLDAGVVNSLINLPSVLCVSIAVSLMPSISSSYALQLTKSVKEKTQLSLKIVWYFTLPCALIYLIYSREICTFLYSNLGVFPIDQISVASTMIKISSLSIIYIALNQILTTILQAINHSYYPVITIIIASVVKISLTIILVLNKNFNIYGLVISDVISYGIAIVLNLNKLKKYINIRFKFKEIVLVPLISLCVLAICLVLFKLLFRANFSRIFVFVSLLVSVSVYILFVLLFKGFNLSEINKTKILKFFKKKKY